MSVFFSPKVFVLNYATEGKVLREVFCEISEKKKNIGIQSVCSIYGSFAHLVYSSVVSRSLIMTESNVVNRFRVPKSGENESKLLK